LTITGRLTLKAYSLSVVYSSRLESQEPVTRDERSRSAKPFGNPDRLSKTTMPRRRASRFCTTGLLFRPASPGPSPTPVFRYPADLTRHSGQDTYASATADPRQANSRTQQQQRRRSVSTRLVPRDPLAPLFVLAAPEGVYPSAVGMPISPPLLRAACPRQNTEKY
jgi:hypothetical protein